MRPLGGLLRNSAKKCFVSSSFATGSAFNRPLCTYFLVPAWLRCTLFVVASSVVLVKSFKTVSANVSEEELTNETWCAGGISNRPAFMH